MLARAEYCKRHKPPLRDWVLSHGRMLGRLARRFPGWLVNVGSTNALTRLILDKFGVDARAPMPVFVPRSFTEWMGDHNAMLTASDRSRLTKKAVFFPGCYVNDYDPQTGKDLVFMLEKAGYEVIVPEFECCGLPMVANGFFDDARAAGLLGDMDPDAAEPERGHARRSRFVRRCPRFDGLPELPAHAQAGVCRVFPGTRQA